MAREIRITISDTGALDVWEGDRHTDQLCFGEMLETIVSLCHHKLDGISRYAMLTDDEWRARHPKVIEPAPPVTAQCKVSEWCDAPDGHAGACNENHVPF